MSIWDLANHNLKSLVPYEPGKPIEDVARELDLDAEKIVKLASNENPLGPSPKALEAMTSAAHSANIYPDGGGYHLRNAIASRFNIDKSQVVLGNGSNEIIELAYHAFTRPGKTSVVASKYAFVVYKLMADLFDVTFLEAPDTDFGHNLKSIKQSIRSDTRLIFIANPNNPTGTLLSNDELEAFIADVPDHVIVILDEAYFEFLANPPGSINWISKYSNLIVMRTFSKIQGLAALRIGYGMMHPDIAEILQRCRQPFNANALAQAAALAGFEDLEHQNKTKQNNDKGLKKFEIFCKEKSIPYIPSYANFITLNVGDADTIFNKLLQKGIIIRSLKSYNMPEWVRISIGTPEEMDQLETELINVLDA